MKSILPILTLTIITSLPLSTGVAATSTTNVAPDNSGRNKEESVTADQQKMNQTDTDRTARIRQELMKDDRLSTYARNVKIISVDGKVTLKGPVESAAEKAIVEKAAFSVVGDKNVNSEITIAN